MCTRTTDQLKSIITNIETCLQGSKRQVLDNLYSGLQGVFSKIEAQISAKEEQTTDHNAWQQTLQMLANGLLFNDLNPAIENLRTKRARTVEAFIKATSHVKTADAGASVFSDSQQQRIEVWLGQERAEPIRQILKSALRKL